MMTIGDLINEYENDLNEAGISDARFDIIEILSSVLDTSPSNLMLKLDKEIDRDITDPLIERLKNNEPVCYILGKAYFFNEEYKVGKGVLIPRPDTEVLVEKAYEVIEKSGNRSPIIWDLCTGTGCVGISLGNLLLKNGIIPTIYLVEKSDEALEYTYINIDQSNCKDKIKIVKLDVLKDMDKISTEQPDFIVSNPPYITSADMKTLDSSVKDYEPEQALFGITDDGLLFYEKMASYAAENLSDGGAIIVEHGYDQADSVKGIFEKNGLEDAQSFKDYGGNMRVTLAYK